MTTQIDADILLTAVRCARLASVDPDILVSTLLNEYGMLLHATHTKDGKRLVNQYEYTWLSLSCMYKETARVVFESKLRELIAELRSA